MTHETVTLLHELGRCGELVEIELVDATHKAERGGKPGSRLPANPGMLSDLEEAWSCITEWILDWRSYFNIRSGPDRTWTSTTTWLALHWPNAKANHPAANDFCDELFHRHTKDCRDDTTGAITCGTTSGHLYRMRIHLGIEQREWKPLGVWTCPTPTETGDPCPGRLLVHTYDQIIRCPRCGTAWQERDYERLGLILGCDPKPVPLPLASDRSGIPQRTLRNWIQGGKLPAERAGKGWLIDVRDVIRLTTVEDGS